MTVALLVASARYEGWRSIRITRSIQSVAGSFDLALTDRWVSGQQLIPVREEDSCRIELCGEIIVDGWIDSRSFSLTPSDFTISVTGRDKAGALVDNSPVLRRWTFRNSTILDIARKVAEPFGVEVVVAPGTKIPKPLRKISVTPGETAFEIIQRIAQTSGVLAVSDGAGRLVLTQTGSERAEALVEGENIQNFTGEYGAAERFYRYVVLTQVARESKGQTSTDDKKGTSYRIRSDAIDENVLREDRVTILTPAQGITRGYANQLADWTARTRAASVETLTATVRGWQQTNGKLWPINALVTVRSPRARVDGEMLISQATYTIDDGGEVTQLSLVRPDAFTPEPEERRVKKKGAGSAFKAA